MNDTPGDTSPPPAGEGPVAERAAAEVTHPAKFSPAVFHALQSIVDRWGAENDAEPTVLDPFGGDGTIHTLERCRTFAVEIEKEWAFKSALLGPTWHHDFLEFSTKDRAECPDVFDIVATSPTYANRMAGNFVGDRAGKYRYIGYAPALGRRLTPGSTAETGWTARYRSMHRRAWAKAWDLLDDGGWLVVNVKDHYRTVDGRKEKQPVVAWHRATMRDLGFEIDDELTVPVPSMKFGQNRDDRVGHEHIIIGVKSTYPSGGGE